MGTPIVAACPECHKQIKASDELAGKKVRCKGCGHVFVMTAAAGAKPQAAKPAPAKPKAKAPAPDADDDNPNPYALADAEELAPRCPHCAKELESAAALICVHCGYNTTTRQRHEMKKVIETTGSDQFMWLLPGLLSVATIFFLIVFDLLFVFVMPGWLRDNDLDFFATGGFRLWTVIASLFLMFFLGVFAVRRLILNPKPPEQETK